MFENILFETMQVGGFFVDLFVLSAPWLVFGFFMAAIIKAFVPVETMYQHLGGQGPWVTVKAALIGAPLPLCSCGVVPAALGLRSAGASKNATVSFLVATPETGVDSVSFTYALMGPVMAVVRPVAAVFSAIMAGLLVGRVEDVANQKTTANKESGCCASEKQKQSVKTSCCTTEASDSKPVEDKPVESSCCDETQGEIEGHQTTNKMDKLLSGLSYAFGQLLRDVVLWLLLGLLVAALVQQFVPDDFFQILGDGLGSMLLMAVIGIPMYVCATASTPIAAGFLLAGVSPGAVLVFMLLGPASNIGTLFIVKNELGMRALVAYLSGLVVTAFAFGFLLNYLTDIYQWSFVVNQLAADHQHHNLFEWVVSAFFAVLVVKAVWDKWITKL
ncbi:SO_0444 family Cu/Zn efflux transporter [Marinicella rhabdoformis]|uniref:SO_0444 family Cu/Zn efflux transporter n=1 Tax=Marinicella rhabdoformis TaxID=2580566 RepID=UPI0012AEB39D|nr:SO_0444 family Cu/Zn efflux transporter [Marinicella rhabdoformis]